MSDCFVSSQSKENVSPGDDEDDSSDDEDKITLLKQFVAFSQFKDEDNPGTHIRYSQVVHWMSQAGFLEGRKITRTDLGVCYFKFKKYKLSYHEFLQFLSILAEYKKIPVNEFVVNLTGCGPPSPEALAAVGAPH